MKRADVVSGAILLVASAVFFYQSTKLEMMYGSSIPGTGFLPYWLSLGMVLLSLLLIVGGLRGSASRTSIQWPSGRGLVWIVSALAALAAYTLLVNVVGYILSTFAFLVVVVRMLSTYRWYAVISFSLAASVGMYLIFATWLQMSLPTGLLIIP